MWLSMSLTRRALLATVAAEGDRTTAADTGWETTRIRLDFDQGVPSVYDVRPVHLDDARKARDGTLIA